MDMTGVFAEMRGQEFIDALRKLAHTLTVRGGRMWCGVCKSRTAIYIGMQECGAPGPPICDTCLQHQRDWMDTAQAVADAIPYCRHCNEDVGREHMYAVSLMNAQAARISL
jgi:hypothetical protein